MMPCNLFGKKMTVIKGREAIYVIDCFIAETPHVKSPWTKQNNLSLIIFVPLDQIPKITTFHMLASEHPEMIEGRRRLIATDVLEYKEAAEDSFIGYDGAALDEEDESG